MVNVPRIFQATGSDSNDEKALGDDVRDKAKAVLKVGGILFIASPVIAKLFIKFRR